MLEWSLVCLCPDENSNNEIRQLSRVKKQDQRSTAPTQNHPPLDTLPLVSLLAMVCWLRGQFLQYQS